MNRPFRRGAPLVAFVACVAFGGAAAAQQDASPAAPPSTSAAESTSQPQSAVAGQGVSGPTTAAGVQSALPPGAATVTGVVITGSRIKRTDLTAAQPVQVIGGQYLQDKGITNLANAINQLPGAGVAITPAGAQGSFGTGRNYINLFNLGSQRTLTLVNGRRYVGANAASQFSGANPGNQVDLNELPTAFLDRIEEVPATGAAVYGSDAIAGVINIIYKDRFTGVMLDGQDGLSQQGDYPTSHITAAVGHDFVDHKLNLAVDFEIDRTGSLTAEDRPWSAAQYTFAANPLNRTSSDGIPANILIANRRVPEVTQGGLAFTSNSISLGRLVTVPDPNNPGARVPAQFAPDGTLVPYNAGVFYQPSVSSGGQGLNLAPLTSLETPLNRKLVNAIGSYEFTPHIRLHTSFFFSDNDATAPANQPIYNSGLFGGTPCTPTRCPLNSANLAFSVNNPFLTPQARANIVASLPPGASTFYLARASTDIVGSSSVVSNTKSYYGAANLEGDFTFLDRAFNWNIAFTSGHANGYFINPGIVQQNFLNAIDAVVNPANGQIVCRSTLANPGNGCQPLNLFGQGAPSAAALAYITTPFRSDFSSDQNDYLANLGGTLFKLPAGDWAFNAGYEGRYQHADFTPGTNARLGVGRAVPIAAASGSFTTNEVYVESLLPILGPGFNFLGGRRFELEGAYRHVDNSLAGTNDAWSFGGHYSPIDGITFRGSRSSTFRAPAITELFLPTSTLFTTALDPCDAQNLNAGPNPTTRQANCQADFQKLGATLNGFRSTIQVATIPGTSGGNPNLKNEVGSSFTYGVVVQPPFIPGLALTADWVQIDITNAIVTFNASSILSTCYDSPSHPTDVCARFTRDNTGQITQIATGYVNAGYTNFAGQAFTLSYDRDLSQLPFVDVSRDLGRLGVYWNIAHTTRFKTSVSGTGYDLSDLEGTIGYSRWKWQLDLRYALGPLRATWTTHFIGRALFNRTYTIENQNILGVGDYHTHDVALEYKIRGTGVTLRGGVNNIFDKAPPYPYTGTTVAVSSYDQIGRYFFGGINARF